MDNATSVSLLLRVRDADDQQAWGRFVGLYAPLIFEWGCRAGMKGAEAADLSQEVLMHLLGELPKFDYAPTRGSFRGWLRTVTVNKCREFQRRKSVNIADDEDRLSQFEDNNPGKQFWEVEYEQRLMKRALQLMRSEFETHIWQAAWKQMVEDQKPADVAVELEMSVAAVYQARSRVLRQLREQLRYLVDSD